MCNIFVLPLLQAQISLHFAPPKQAFSTYRSPFKCIEWPPNDLKTSRSKLARICPNNIRASHISLLLRVTGHFETNAPNAPKMQSVSLYSMSVLGYRLLGDRYLEWPQMILNTTGSKVPHICPNNIHASHISLLLRVTGNFETSAPNVPKMLSNTTRSKVPYTRTHKCKNSLVSFCN